ncbi:precorrin-2 dehydrogenase/sirohydrochlorin ferrochelatase family protein [Bacillus alkalicellulosilyticus]|uniref:precorrin-2 dehydrogenase/sirohydrochlorin ferrochelatase family protein n=1 Tax=Alkalihalobacterium alkalicellulosilyticum TaxID=1912214 RepID=UPI000995F43E|nr:bifunctional precorrin-2 dehydrogenase/sirohydrochlorin ferrochelatase [Bacillus alkalicellulosilyticus]
MSLYPVMLNIKGKKVVVVGGGKIAFRKVKGLLPCGANIFVVSPDIIDEFLPFIKTGQVHWLKEHYRHELIEGAFIVFAATDNPEVNRTVYEESSEQQLVSRVDDIEQTDFFVPSVVKRGKLTLAVSTEGASPALARQITKELTEKYDQRYEDIVDFLGAARHRIKQKIKDPNQRETFLKRLIEEEIYKLTDREKIIESWTAKNSWEDK